MNPGCESKTRRVGWGQAGWGEEARQPPQRSLPACSQNTVPPLGAGFRRRDSATRDPLCLCPGVCKGRMEPMGVKRFSVPRVMAYAFDSSMSEVGGRRIAESLRPILATDF